jgi:hypothetical protein
MEVNTGTPAKRSRAKVKSAATKATKSVAAPAQKPRAPKKVAASTLTVTTAPVVKAIVEERPSTDQLRGMIAMAAYYRAAARHFSPGHELDDWLEAERQINALFG